MSATSHATYVEQARQLLCRYTHLIDDGKLDQWPLLFTDECCYRITTREIVSLGQSLSIMLCTSKGMLFDRVEATQEANLFEPHYYRHVLSDSIVTGEKDDGALELTTNFFCMRTMMNGDSMLFVTGQYIDEIVTQGSQCLFRSKWVVLDQSKIDTLIAIPI